MKFTNKYAILQNKVIVNAKKNRKLVFLVKRSYNKVYSNMTSIKRHTR